MQFDIRPIEGKSYEGRQYGWCIYKDDLPYIDVSMGGTGPCWNLDDADGRGENPGTVCPLHICELDELIGALEHLRDSDVHKANVDQWT